MTVTPPSEVTLPPLVAEFEEMSVIVERMTVGTTLMAAFLQLIILISRSADNNVVKREGLFFMVNIFN